MKVRQRQSGGMRRGKKGVLFRWVPRLVKDNVNISTGDRITQASSSPRTKPCCSSLDISSSVLPFVSGSSEVEIKPVIMKSAKISKLS